MKLVKRENRHNSFMNSTFQLEIISPLGIIFQDQVNEVTLETPTGQISILPHHVPLASKVSAGEVRIRQGEKEALVAVTGGFIEVAKGRIVIISDYAIRAESIEEAKAQEAKRRAETLLSERRGEQDFIEIEKELRKSLLELKIAEKIRRRQKGV